MCKKKIDMIVRKREHGVWRGRESPGGRRLQLGRESPGGRRLQNKGS